MIRRILDSALVVAALVALWQGVHLLAPFALSSPAATAAKIHAMLGGESFWRHAAETGRAFGYSLALAACGGLALGLGLGLNRTASQVAEPILVSVYSLPKVTLYPVILLIFGLGLPAKVAFGTIHGIIPIAIFAMNAARKLAPVYLRTARVFRLGRADTLVRVIVPAALPEIVSGLRIGVSLTLLGVLIGEMFASQRGLGYMIMNAIGLHDIETIMAVIVVLGAVAFSANVVLLWIDQRLHRRTA